MPLSPLAGKPAPADLLIDVEVLLTAYQARKPDLNDPLQLVSFGTSGHRGTAADGTFNEAHILAITQAICDYRASQRTTGPIFLGKDVSGKPMVVDLSTLPHLLIAGRTGTGKSVCLNSIIVSMLMTRRPDEVRLLLVDPKMVELSPYKKLPHLMHPVVTDMRKAEAILAWAVEKMEERYALLARAGVRHIGVYNQLGHDELMERLHLAHLAAANPFTLSGGEKRRLSVATALATAPALLVLDEPTFGQDRRTWSELLDLLAALRDGGRGVCFVTHDRPFARALADRALTLRANA